MNKRIINVCLGVFICAIAYNLFLKPYNFVTGGVSGLAIIANYFFNINVSVFIFIVNIGLIIISYLLLGKEKTKNTILGSLLFPFFTFITSNITDFIVLDIDPLILCLVGGMLSGIGYGMIFQNNYTTGGTDILNQIMEKYMKIPMSKSILIVDGTIVIIGGIVFGVLNLVYSFIALYLISYFSNNIQIGVNKNRLIYITSYKDKEIRAFLISRGYDATIIKSIGGFTHKSHKTIMCSVNENDYYGLKKELLKIDPEVFLVVTNAYEQKNANVLLRKSQKINTRNA